jgi:hypothetical protein
MTGVLQEVKIKILKKIKIVEDEKDSQENIDNHSGQNYNVEHFCICTHELYLFFTKPTSM